MRLSLDPVVGLSLGRIGVGVLALTQPEETAKRFRLGSATAGTPGSGQLTYMTRLFGSREIALGVITLLAPRKTRRRLALAGIGIDAADAYASVVAIRDGSLDTTTGGILTVPAVGAVLAGLGSLRRSRRTATAERRSAAVVAAD